jgi:voltage-gated potassium channel
VSCHVGPLGDPQTGSARRWEPSLSYVAALTVLDVERTAPGANIATMGDALRWAMAAITTVGYGDFYPATVVGQLIAVALTIGGLAVLGVVTATLASWLVESIAAGTTAEAESGDQALQGERISFDFCSRAMAPTVMTRRSDNLRDRNPQLHYK